MSRNSVMKSHNQQQYKIQVNSPDQETGHKTTKSSQYSQNLSGIQQLNQKDQGISIQEQNQNLLRVDRAINNTQISTGKISGSSLIKLYQTSVVNTQNQTNEIQSNQKSNNQRNQSQRLIRNLSKSNDDIKKQNSLNYVLDGQNKLQQHLSNFQPNKIMHKAQNSQTHSQKESQNKQNLASFITQIKEPEIQRQKSINSNIQENKIQTQNTIKSNKALFFNRKKLSISKNEKTSTFQKISGYLAQQNQVKQQQSFEKIKDLQPEHKAIFEKLIQKQIDLENNLCDLKNEHSYYQKYKNLILRENISLIEKTKIKEERIKIEMRRKSQNLISQIAQKSRLSTLNGLMSFQGNIGFNNYNQRPYSPDGKSIGFSERCKSKSPTLKIAFKPSRNFQRVINKTQMQDHDLTMDQDRRSENTENQTKSQGGVSFNQFSKQNQSFYSYRDKLQNRKTSNPYVEQNEGMGKASLIEPNQSSKNSMRGQLIRTSQQKQRAYSRQNLNLQNSNELHLQSSNVLFSSTSIDKKFNKTFFSVRSTNYQHQQSLPKNKIFKFNKSYRDLGQQNLTNMSEHMNKIRNQNFISNHLIHKQQSPSNSYRSYNHLSSYKINLSRNMMGSSQKVKSRMSSRNQDMDQDLKLQQSSQNQDFSNSLVSNSRTVGGIKFINKSILSQTTHAENVNMKLIEKARNLQQDQPLMLLYQRKNQNFQDNQKRSQSLPRGAQYYARGIRI